MESINYSDYNAGVAVGVASSRDYLRVLFRQKNVVITTILVVIITVFLGLTLKTPVYEAQVKMLISAKKEIAAPYYRELLGDRNVQDSLTQSEIVISAPVLERGVQALGLSQRPLDYEKQYASPLKSALVELSANIQKVQLNRYTPAQQQLMVFRAAVRDLKKRIKVEPIRDTNLFVITVREFDPIGAAVAANVVSRSYVIFDLEQQLAELTLKYGDQHPSVLQMKDSIAKMAHSLNGNSLSNIDAIGPASVKIIEQANIPLKPVGPRKPLVLFLGLVMSVFLGVMLAVVFEYMDSTFKSSRDIETWLNLPFLGSICRRKRGEEILIRSFSQKTNDVQFCQILSDQLYLLVKDKKIKSILVTSSGPREGVSSIIANLGLFLSQKAGHNVLLLDANFRNPSLDKLFKVDHREGLADLIQGNVSLKDAAKEAGKGLYVIAAGQTELNPMILLDSAKVGEIMEEAKKKYELIFIDGPNLTQYRDTVVLAAHTDATAVVVSEGVTRRHVVKAALQPLIARNVNILGVILNNRTFPIPKFVYERV